jgi:hypothetical protein
MAPIVAALPQKPGDKRPAQPRHVRALLRVEAGKQ